MKNYYKKVGKPYKAADALHVDFPNFGGRGVPRGPTMVPQVSSHRLFNTSRRCIWYRLARICDASFDWGLPTPSLGGKGVCMGSEIAPLSSPGTISYRLPIVTICLFLTVFAVLRMFHRQTDGRTNRRNWSIAIGPYLGGICTKVHRPPKQSSSLTLLPATVFLRRLPAAGGG